MSNLVAYSLLSRTCVWLEAHLRLLRQNLPELNRIVVVQGPYSSPTSSEDAYLSPQQADNLGVQLLEAPETIAEHVGGVRQALLRQWILQAIQRQAESLALIVDGDVFLLRPTSSEELLAGKSVAGRAWRGHWAWTWVFLTKDAAKSLRDVATQAHVWPSEQPISAARCREWGVDAAGLEDVEWCEPAWLHVNSMSMDAPERIDRKKTAFGKLLQLCGETACTPLQSQRCAPHVYTPIERERLRDGSFLDHFFEPPTPEEIARRRAIYLACDDCTDRPDGCWKAKSYGCENERRAAHKLFLQSGQCPHAAVKLPLPPTPPAPIFTDTPAIHYRRTPGDNHDMYMEVVEQDCYRLRNIGGPIRYAVDVGANIGTFTRFANQRWPGVKVLAFEPHQNIRQYFDANTAGVDVTLVQAACVDASVGLEVTYEAFPQDCGGNTIVKRLPDKYSLDASQTTVPTCRLSEQLDKFAFPRVDLLKIDVEGAEGMVLGDLQAAGWLPRIARIVGEYHGLDQRERVQQLLADTHVTEFQPGPVPGIGMFWSSPCGA